MRAPGADEIFVETVGGGLFADAIKHADQLQNADKVELGLQVLRTPTAEPRFEVRRCLRAELRPLTPCPMRIDDSLWDAADWIGSGESADVQRDAIRRAAVAALATFASGAPGEPFARVSWTEQGREMVRESRFEAVSR